MNTYPFLDRDSRLLPRARLRTAPRNFPRLLRLRTALHFSRSANRRAPLQPGANSLLSCEEFINQDVRHFRDSSVRICKENGRRQEEFSRRSACWETSEATDFCE